MFSLFNAATLKKKSNQTTNCWNYIIENHGEQCRSMLRNIGHIVVYVYSVCNIVLYAATKTDNSKLIGMIVISIKISKAIICSRNLLCQEYTVFSIIGSANEINGTHLSDKIRNSIDCSVVVVRGRFSNTTNLQYNQLAHFIVNLKAFITNTSIHVPFSHLFPPKIHNLFEKIR